MVKGVFTGSSLGKISGHRKGDIAEKFDMHVCISCHYEDSAHGVKRVYKDFCSRCHDVRSPANVVMGPTHLALPTVSSLNYVNGALVLSFALGIFIFFGYRSRKKIANGVKSWLGKMRVEEEQIQKEEGAEDKEKETPQPEFPPEQPQEGIKKEEPEQKQENTEGQEPAKEKGEEEPVKVEDSAKEERKDAAPAQEEKPQEEGVEEKGENRINQQEDEQPPREEPHREENEEQKDNGNDEQKGTQ
jgi:hypothetical protein